MFDRDKASRDEAMGVVRVLVSEMDGQERAHTLQPMKGCKVPSGEVVMICSALLATNSADYATEPSVAELRRMPAKPSGPKPNAPKPAKPTTPKPTKPTTPKPTKLTTKPSKPSTPKPVGTSPEPTASPTPTRASEGEESTAGSAGNAVVPVVCTAMMDRLEELGVFRTEGVFRISGELADM